MRAVTLPSLQPAFVPAAAGLSLGLLAWGLLFLPECVAAVGVWRASDTYGHCFLILPMAAYLAWDRRAALAGLAPQPLPVLAPLAVPVAAVWFLAERLGIMEGRQLAAIVALELLLLAVLGWRLFRALRAPLLFLVFLVPFGAFVTPMLQRFTAGFIVRGLNALGVANYATDLTIEISAGVFYVAEACAGLRFLIAAVAFGVFYALLNYRSPGRRLLFVAASVVVPVLANGVRALGIVVLGAILGSANAAAADHVIYGWMFFSLVMLLLVAGGMPFREDPPNPAPSRPPGAISPDTKPVWAAAAVVLLLAPGPTAAMVLARRVAPALLTEALAVTAPPGCTADPAPATALPAQRVTTTLSCAGQHLVVTVEAFPRRSTASSLIRERRRITGAFAEEATVTALPTSQAASGDWTLVHTTGPPRTVAHASWIGGVPAQDGLADRVRQARHSLFGTAYAPVLVTAVIESPKRPDPAEQQKDDALLRGFVDAQANLTTRVAAVARSAQP